MVRLSIPCTVAGYGHHMGALAPIVFVPSHTMAEIIQSRPRPSWVLGKIDLSVLSEAWLGLG